MRALFYWVGTVLLLLAAVAMLAAMAWGQVGVEVAKVVSVPVGLVQAALGVWSVTFLWAALMFTRAGWSRWAVRRALRQAGPKGEILITQNTVQELVSTLLEHELRLTKFRVVLRPSGQGIALRINLYLPPGEEIPKLAERVQTLLSEEIHRRTGLEVPEVRLAVLGALRRKR